MLRRIETPRRREHRYESARAESRSSRLRRRARASACNRGAAAMNAKQRLLIVDDQSANIRVMAEALQSDYELYFATSGAKAIDIAGANEIDLILLDVVMPDMNGLDVCPQLNGDDRT